MDNELSDADLNDLLHAQTMQEDFNYILKKCSTQTTEDLIEVFKMSVRIVNTDVGSDERDRLINELESFFR